MALAGLTWEVCLAYLDDLIIFSRTFDHYIERLQKVFDRLVAAGLKLKPSKCAVFQKRVKFLGSIVSGEGMEPDPEKVQAVAQWPTPRTVTEVRAFVATTTHTMTGCECCHYEGQLTSSDPDSTCDTYVYEFIHHGKRTW